MRCIRRFGMFLACWLLLTCCLSLGHAQPSPTVAAAGLDAPHDKDAQANPAGVSCLLRVAGGRSQFHIGERIPLEIVFSSTSPQQYQIDTDAGDRTLMWSSDTFQVSPADGVSDPLAAYLRFSLARGWAYEGPGPRWRALGAKPIVVPLDLNEWEDFQKPGHYQISLTCRRLLADAKHTDDLLFQGIATTSNEIDLDILPTDAAWADAQMRGALPAYNSPDEAYQTQDTHRAAARTVRFLDTPETIAAMVRRYGTLTQFEYWNSPVYFQTKLGLFGSAHKDFVVAEMRRQLAAPDFPVTAAFLADLAEVEHLAEHPDGGLPPTKAEMSTPDADEIAETRRLAQALPQKHGRALAVSLATLQQSAQALSLPGRTVTALQANVRRELAATFDTLPPESQAELLEDPLWPLVRGPAMLPALRRLYRRSSVADVESGVVQLRDQALGRIYELSPPEGRRLVLAEMRLRHPRVEVQSLTDLPDRTLPALDDMLAAHLAQSAHLWDEDAIDIQSQLIARYAAAAILSRVKTFYRAKGGYAEWWTPTQPALLAYFLRVDPAYGTKMLQQGIWAKRPPQQVSFDLMQQVSQFYYCPALEKVAVQSLDDPGDMVVCDAATVLGAHGSPAAEAPLWTRLRRWNRQWRGRTGELAAWQKGRSIQKRPDVVLAQALALSPAWLVEGQGLAEIKRLCLSPDTFTQAQIETVDSRRKFFLYADTISDDGQDDQWRVGQYTLSSMSALRRKLAQYPRGTVFHWVLDGGSPHPERNAQAFAQIKQFLQRLDMDLVKS